MGLEGNAKRRNIVVRSAGVLVGLLGLYIITGIAWPLRNINWHDDLWGSLFFMFAFPIPGTILGCFCLFAAYKTWRAADVSIADVRRISLIAAILLALTVSVWAHRLLKDSVWADMTDLPLPLAAGGAIYLMCVSWLAKWLGLSIETDWKKRQRAARLYFCVLAIVSWSAMGSAAIEVVPEDGTAWHLPQQPWFALAVFGPLVLAVVLYYVCVHFAMRGKPKESRVVE